MLNLISRVTRMAAPDGAASGSADSGTPAPGAAEDSLKSAFGGADAGAEGGEARAKPGKGSTAAGGTEPGGGIRLAAWAEQLPPEMRENAETAARLAKFSKVGDMAKAFLELEGRAAGPAVPGKNATAEEAAEFWEKAGRPKSAEGYAFAKDREHEGALFADAAFAANLTAAQAEAVFAGLNKIGAAKLEAAARARERQMKETAAALAAEYGSAYDEKMELLTRGLAAAGPNVGKLISQAGLAGNPEIVRAFIAFGRMTAESGAARGGGAGESLKTFEGGGSFDFKT